VHNYLNMRPADQAGDCGGVTTALGAGDVVPSSSESDNGSSMALWVGAGVAAIVLLGGGALLAARRRTTAGDRE